MKVDSRRLIIAVAFIALGGLIASRSLRSERASPPVAAEPVATDTTSPVVRRAGTSQRSVVVVASSVTEDAGIAATLAQVHRRLHDYLTRQTDDDATGDAITQELAALVTDENAPALARGLSRQEIQTPFGTAVLARWLKAEPATAAAWLAAHGETTEEQNWQLGQAVEKSTDAFDAADRALPDGALRQTMLNAAALARADADPRRALALTQRMAPGPAQTSAFETIVYAWATSDIDAAGQWARSVNDPALRERVLAAGAKALASSEPDLAASWLSATASPGPVANDTALLIAQAWVAKNAPAAAAWVGSLKDPGVRLRAMEAVVNQWMAMDAAAAGRWIAQQPEGAEVLAKLHAQEDAADTPKE